MRLPESPHVRSVAKDVRETWELQVVASRGPYQHYVHRRHYRSTLVDQAVRQKHGLIQP